ncbi:Pimeloyl-ACP methyl ester carboxylesterase [Arthrobacter sp. ov407]|uniref:alpha/beta fold hydrolase n=1 Tax=Arthrobacter sp. ov407 TaxID=1761748 RepID=UPI00087FFA1C|nr:alpha/beta fold hydrolase [Arthrobacter sp. ov407]SDL99603.1 Pimeloyl-ACP methyl ester carboxylesterase [Arthrobacter sp. ov407]
MTFTHGYGTNGDLRMYYEVHGHPRADEPPLLLIPGGGSTIETNYAGLIPALLAESLQVIAVDEEGHGRTAATGRPLTAENSADDVKAVLDELNVDSVDVLGFSAGGHTALALAMRYPASVRCLIAASTFVSRDAVSDEFWDGMAKGTLGEMPEALQDADRKLHPEPGHLERLFELDRQRILTFPGWQDDDLRRITARTLVLSADRDVMSPEHAVRMSRVIPGARLMIVPGTHGDYLGELAASGGDLRAMRTTVPYLLRFLEE